MLTLNVVVVKTRIIIKHKAMFGKLYNIRCTILKKSSIFSESHRYQHLFSYEASKFTIFVLFSVEWYRIENTMVCSNILFGNFDTQ